MTTNAKVYSNHLTTGNKTDNNNSNIDTNTEDANNLTNIGSNTGKNKEPLPLPCQGMWICSSIVKPLTLTR